jgi:hypothetical protein
VELHRDVRAAADPDLLIHLQVKGFANVNVGGTHIRHYVWGILIVICVAFASLIERSPNWRIVLGLLFGTGLALVIDESALLVEVRDVYWQGPGLASIAVAVILIAVTGSILTLLRSKHVRDLEPQPEPVTQSGEQVASASRVS